jgi:transposase
MHTTDGREAGMFVKKTPAKNGRTYLSIVEGYWDAEKKMSRTRTVRKIGYLDELLRSYNDPVAHFEFEAKSMAEKAKDTKEMTLVIGTDRHMKPGTDKNKNFGYAAISKVYHELKLDEFFGSRQRSLNCEYNLNSIMKMLVYSRILAPASKRRTYMERGRYFDKMDFSLDDVYRSLSDISKYVDDLQIWIHERIRVGADRDTSIVFYDVTNYYFEIDEQDEIRRKGVSKEHRPDPIIQMGLFMDSDGLPIAYQLFPGNCNDCQTLVPLMKEVRRKYALGKAVVVADKGMNTGRNAYYLANSRGGYIFSQTVRGGSADLKKYILKTSGYVGLPEKSGFKMKSRQYTRIVDFEEEDGTAVHAEISEKQIVFYSPDYDKREKALRADTVAKARDLVKNPGKYNRHNSYGAAKYVKELQYDKKTGEILTPAELLKFDQAKLDEEERYDGYYLIVTSRFDKPDNWVLDNYRGLWQIEETFKVTKNDLEARPVFASRRDRIAAHFLTCFVALVISRIMQHRLGRRFSPENIADSMAKAICMCIDMNMYVFCYYNETLKAIGETFGIDFSREFMSLGEIRTVIGETKK